MKSPRIKLNGSLPRNSQSLIADGVAFDRFATEHALVEQLGLAKK